jgi:hypothetical protein
MVMNNLRSAAPSGATLLATLLAALAATPASAQSVQSAATAPPSGRPLTVGNLQLYPSISLREIGVDTNIYNETVVVREDFTYTVAPRVVAELPLGDSHLVGTGGLGFIFFRQYKDQQTLNGLASGLFEVRTGRVRPSVSGGINRSRQRGGDVDMRALSVSTNGRVGVEAGLSGITSLTAWVMRDKTAFAPGQRFREESLSDQLDRSSTTFAAGVRLDLTPLTSVVAAAELEQTRFTVSRYRDSDSLKIAPAVRFAEGAILNGEASLGVRDFRSVSGALPPFRGLVARGDLRFTVMQVTRVELRATRDVFYSYDTLYPYYLEAGGQATVSQRIVGPLEAIGLAGRRTLRYKSIDASGERRLETIRLWGGGFGVRVDDNMRFTLTVDRERRETTRTDLRQYDRTRVFAALEYLP